MVEENELASLDLDKDIQSIHSNSSTSSHHNVDIDIEKQDESRGSEDAIAIEPTTTRRTGVSAGEKGVVSKVISRISTKSSWIDPGPPPNGGLKAWMQVFFGHLVIMNTWGFINSFGVFQTYYVTALGRPDSDIAWIGSIQVFLLFFIGTFTGRLTDSGYFHAVFITGSVIGVFGLFMASLSTTYWQLFLSQGVCFGLGCGCLFCPVMSQLSTYWSTRRSLAIGIAAAGSATGGIVFPAMVQQLLPKIGLPWTIRSLAFIQLPCLIVCNIGLRPRVPPRKTGALVDWASFKEKPYVFFAVGMFFNFQGVYFAFFYMGSFARTIIGLPYEESINLLLVLNGVGAIGRIVPNHLADRFFGPMNCIIPSVVASSFLYYCWIAVTNRAGLYGWAIVYGIVGAAIQSLFPATLSSLTTNLRMMGTRMGMVFTIVSFAVLTGPPIAGALIAAKDGEYQYAQIFAGLDLTVGCCFLIAARVCKSRKLKFKM
ncbi:major facilitator superfamily domain-containing protein [Calycina marina]|uniref:Major facilitator superfamily domain-containing protein n=1 Tax=Calycina marina TaxID=1763456 RepID=A0A9P7Z8U9_9HELO|nr:major facilitator superfamily domain-containing protein [Calycina marina]